MENHPGRKGEQKKITLLCVKSIFLVENGGCEGHIF
jgi:hypothetical protein